MCCACVRVFVPLCALWDLLMQKHKPSFGQCVSLRDRRAARGRMSLPGWGWWCPESIRGSGFSLQDASQQNGPVKHRACEWDAVHIVYVKVAWVNSEAALFLSTTMASAPQWPRTHWLCKTLLFCILNILVSRRKHFIMLQPLWYRVSAFVPCKTFTNWKKGTLAKKKMSNLWIRF